MAVGGGQHTLQDAGRQRAGVARQVPFQHEAQRLHPAAVVQPAAQPFRTVGGVGHLALPEGEQVGFEVFLRQPVGEAGAGTAAIQAEHQPGHVRRAAVGQRPQVEAAVIAMHPRAARFGHREFRTPDQRAIGEQPHRPAAMLGHADLHRGAQLFRAEMFRRPQRRRIHQITHCGRRFHALAPKQLLLTN
ncbi:hypothetical protein D3C78_1449320 [compost metagenome]